MLTLKFFAHAADVMGQREFVAPFQASALELLGSLPSLAILKDRMQVRVAVNRRWAEWTTKLKDGDEVAFLPPLSGG